MNIGSEGLCRKAGEETVGCCDEVHPVYLACLLCCNSILMAILPAERPSIWCRWIERFNNKLRQPAKKEEARRMKQFVNDAFAQDPRILQRRAEEKAQR